MGALQGEEYKLMWKPTFDFMHMCLLISMLTIVPFEVLGANETYM
jgi:hypothetical protein